nr:hypothetical protein [Tanacetum cinerariifolium]
MEQYLALTRGNQASDVVKLEIRGNVNFEIKSQFMRELREDSFFGNKNNDAYEHVEWVLDIVSLFNIPGVSYDTVMLRVFPITLTRAAKRWMDRLTPRMVNTWICLKKPLSKGIIHPLRLQNSLKKSATLSKKTKADHSQKWHDSSSSKNVRNSSNSEGIAAIVSKLDSLGRDMKKLKENVYAIQVGCQTCGGPHLEKECPLNEEVKSVKDVKYGEIRRHFPTNSGNGAKYHVETQIEQLTKEYHAKAACEVTNSSIGRCKAVFANDNALIDETSSKETNELHIVYFIVYDDIQVSTKEDVVPSGVMPCQLPPKALNPGSFTLSCTIGSLNLYAMADLGAVTIMKSTLKTLSPRVMSSIR